MLDYLRRLATTGFAYTGASVISKLVAVALLPVYTALVSPFEYGQAEVLFAAVVAFSIFVRFGLLEALLRFYYLPDERGPDVVRTGFAALFWTVTVVRAGAAAVRRRRSPARSTASPAWSGSRSAGSGC